MIIGKYNKSVILTYLGVCLSVTGMALVTHGMTSWAMICLMFAGICDLFDGAAARRCRRDEAEKQFGVQIDSLADMISFAAFPAVLGFYTVGSWGLPVFMVYVLCAVIRLAWFNMTANSEGHREYYQGLPVTYSAVIFPVLWLLNGFIGDFAYSAVTAAVYLAAALLFILDVKIKKPRGVWYVIFAVLALLVTALIIIKEVL